MCNGPEDGDLMAFACVGCDHGPGAIRAALVADPWLRRPDALAAVRTLLGELAGRTIRNRATPLFSFVSTGASDHAYTTTPQTALALMINNAANYAPTGPTIDLYPSFPDDPLIAPGEVPRATMYVLSTRQQDSG